MGFLGLEEERVAAVASEQEDDPRPGADAADTDHLAGHVHHLELLEEMPSITLERLAVPRDEFVEGEPEVVVALSR